MPLSRKLDLKFHCTSQPWTWQVCLVDFWWVLNLSHAISRTFRMLFFIIFFFKQFYWQSVGVSSRLWLSPHESPVFVCHIMWFAIIWNRPSLRIMLSNTFWTKMEPLHFLSLMVARHGQSLWTLTLLVGMLFLLAGWASFATMVWKKAISAYLNHQKAKVKSPWYFILLRKPTTQSRQVCM